MSKQQTALNWFVNQRPPRALEDVYDLLQQALEMEKQQIIMAYHNGYSDAIQAEPKQYEPQHYYNETFNTKNQ